MRIKLNTKLVQPGSEFTLNIVLGLSIGCCSCLSIYAKVNVHLLLVLFTIKGNHSPRHSRLIMKKAEEILLQNFLFGWKKFFYLFIPFRHYTKFYTKLYICSYFILCCLLCCVFCLFVCCTQRKEGSDTLGSVRGQID